MAVERIRQQKTPGQFGIEATNISQVDLGAASYSRPGVVDRSKGVMAQGIAGAAQTLGRGISTAVEQGHDFYEGLQIADVEKEHEKNIQDYIASKNNPQIAADAALDASTLEGVSNSLWNKLGEGASIEDIDNVEKHYQSKLETMKNAVRQGVMSPDEFTQRALAITRTAVNRNPALYDDLINHTKKVMNLSGIDKLLEADKQAGESAQKQYQKRVDYATQIAKENDIPVRYDAYGNVDLAHLEKQNGIVQQEKFAAEAYKRFDTARTNQDKEAVRQFVGNNGYNMANGIINNLNTVISDILRNPDNKGEQTTKIRQAYALAKQEMAGKVGQFMHFPEVKEVYDYFNKVADTHTSIYEKLTTREDQQKYAENVAKIMRDRDYVRIASVSSPAAVEQMTKILSVVGPRIQEADPLAYQKLTKTLGNIFNKVSNGLDTDYQVKDQSGMSAIASASRSLATDSGKGDANAKSTLDNVVETVYADSKTKFNSTGEKFKFYDDYIRAMADEGAANGWKSLSESARTKAGENFDEYMGLTMGGFQEDLAAVRNKGGDVKLSTLPDGRLVIQTSNPTDTEQLNQKYGIRINNGLKAFANIIGADTKKAAELLYSQYEPLKNVIPAKTEDKNKDGKPNASNPLNIKEPGKDSKRFQQYGSVEEGIRAASVQLDRYYTGKTPGTGKGLNTLDQIGGLWNNEKEAGSTSKVKYVATLAKYMGVDKDEPLDLSDPNVKADLIHAMSIAEGRPVRPSLIRTALGK